MKIAISIICAAACLVTAANASVTVAFSVDLVRDSGGTAVSSAAGAATGLLVVDTTGQGFGLLQNGQSITVGSFIGADSNLKVVHRADFSTFATDGVWSQVSNFDLTDGVSTNDEMAFIWLPTLASTTNIINASDPYGLANVSNWVVPSDGGTASPDYQIISNTNSGFFTTNANTFQATDPQTFAIFSVVPEPSQYATLAALGALLMVARRRR